jgi:hypothetical protein
VLSMSMRLERIEILSPMTSLGALKLKISCQEMLRVGARVKNWSFEFECPGRMYGRKPVELMLAEKP